MSDLIVSRFQVVNIQYTVFAPIGDPIYFVSKEVNYYLNTKPLHGAPLGVYQCIGYDKYEYSAKKSPPYATATIIHNSTECGYNPDAPSEPLAIEDISATGETGINLKNGTVQAIVSGGTGHYYYSHDGTNFQVLLPSGADITISELAPGNYILTVKDSFGITKTATFSIDAYQPVLGCMDNTALNYNPLATQDNGTCLYPPTNPGGEDPNPDSRQNLYEAADQFRLIRKDGAIYLIDMPKGWENVIFKLVRDENYHGVNFEYSDGSIELEFDWDAGMEYLRTEYNLNGNDGYMGFQFGQDVFGNFIPDVDAYIDFNTYKISRDYVSLSVKRKTFSDALETKNEVDVTLTDGYFPLPLHSKVIRRNVTINRDGRQTPIDHLGINKWQGVNPNFPNNKSNGPFLQAGLVYWTFLDFTQPPSTDSGYSSYVNDLTPEAPNVGFTTSDPLKFGEHLFKADGSAKFTFDINFGLWIRTKLTQPTIGNPKVGDWSYKWFLVVNKTRYELPGGSTGSTRSIFNDVYFQTNYHVELNINQGDEVYLFGQYVCQDIGTHSQFEGHMDINFCNIKISADTLSTPTTTQAKLAHEVFAGIIASISNNKATLKSDLLGRPDIGYNETGCAALIAYTNGYLMRGFKLVDRPLIITLKDGIEGLDALYAIGQGYEYDQYGNWIYRIEQQEYFYKDVLITVFDNVSDYLETIDTKLIYNELSFGYEKYTKELEQVSTIDEFNTQHDYLTEIESYKGKLSKLCKQIAAGYAIELTRRVQYATNPDVSWTYDEDNFIIAVVPDQKYAYKPEKAENFTASGIISTETVYNLRFTITRMLDSWGKWINSGLAYKKLSSVIKNTYTSKNGDLTSKYTGVSCGTDKEFTESANLLKADLANGEQLFFPITISFKARCSWETLRMLRRCFNNTDPQLRNNGYIGVVDGNGVTQYGYLTSLEYNPNTELTVFNLRKKYVDLSEPFDCSIYTFNTFGDFEQATGLPAEIEQCKFENFA